MENPQMKYFGCQFPCCYTFEWNKNNAQLSQKCFYEGYLLNGLTF